MSNWRNYIQPVQLSMQIDYSGGTAAIYIGETLIGLGALTTSPCWRIKKLTYDVNGNVLTVLWSPLANQFGDIWANRSTLTYA